MNLELNSPSFLKRGNAGGEEEEEEEEEIIKEDFVYVKFKNLSIQNQVRRYLILRPTSLDLVDWNSNTTKEKIDLKEQTHQIFICDVHQKKNFIDTKRRDNLFSLRFCKPEGELSESIPVNEIELNNTDNNDNDNTSIFNHICFKVESKIEKEDWMKKIAFVRLKCLGENPKNYQMLFPVNDIDDKEDKNVDADNKTDNNDNRNNRQVEKGAIRVNGNTTTIESEEEYATSNPLFDGSRQIFRNPKSSNNKKFSFKMNTDHKKVNKITTEDYYFYVDNNDYRGLQSRVNEFFISNMYNYALPQGLDKSEFPIKTILWIGLLINVILFVFFSWNTLSQYQQNYPGQFLSPSLSTNNVNASFFQGGCQYTPTSITNTFSIDSNGYWSTNPLYQEQNKIIQVELNEVYAENKAVYQQNLGVWILEQLESLNKNFLHFMGIPATLIKLGFTRYKYVIESAQSGGNVELSIPTNLAFLMKQFISPSPPEFAFVEYDNSEGIINLQPPSIPTYLRYVKPGITHSGSFNLDFVLSHNNGNITVLNEYIENGNIYDCKSYYQAFMAGNLTFLSSHPDLQQICQGYLFTQINIMGNNFLEEVQETPFQGQAINPNLFFNFTLWSSYYALQILLEEFYTQEIEKDVDLGLFPGKNTYEYDLNSMMLAAGVNLNIIRLEDLTRLGTYSNTQTLNISAPTISMLPYPLSNSTLNGWGIYTSPFQEGTRIVCRDKYNENVNQSAELKMQYENDLKFSNTTSCAVPIGSSDYGGYFTPLFTDTSAPLPFGFRLTLLFQLESMYNPCNFDTENLIKEQVDDNFTSSLEEDGFLPQCKYAIMMPFIVQKNNDVQLESGALLNKAGQNQSNVIQYGINDLSSEDAASVDLCSLSEYKETFLCEPPANLTSSSVFICSPAQWSVWYQILGSSYANSQLIGLLVVPIIITLGNCVIFTLKKKTEKEKKEEKLVKSTQNFL